MAKVLKLPVIPSLCPANGHTKRDDIEQMLSGICKKIPNARELILSALQNEDQYGLWNRPKG